MNTELKSGDLKLDNHWMRLALTVQSRMNELELNQQRLAERSCLSPSVVGDLQRGTAKHYQPRTLLDVAVGLELHPMALISVLAGDKDACRLGLRAASPARAGTPDRQVA